ncbi:Tim44/TimA family putative adaptor protein [Albimonas pacifica]|uniref:Predicted lipid-binding transport protein, Tim44 family n=1 Tax=Albimonas pacifica TaxID=1114924 RepID=A0A1I3FPG2_9RHOB|nr:Tim44/TimA family putative adaptor protein [Albimonas pacifica]SFI13113.1 Predicted lipid-binding transport protein, Tim44 family [Albimonas pacifica]
MKTLEMDDMTQLIILAAIAIFVLWRLKNVLGTRTGYERMPGERPEPAATPSRRKSGFEVIEGTANADAAIDADIARVADVDGETGESLRRMARAEPGFRPSEFVDGAKQAYEMILMAFETGDTRALRPLLSDEVYQSFVAAIRQRETEGLTVEARFVGVKEARIFSAMFSDEDREADIEVRFVGELVSVVRNAEHQVVEGDPNEIRRQTDLWTFTRKMGSNDPNWVLTATGG